MLTLVIPPQEFWDEKKEEFVYSDSVTLKLEHSLVSISKWEAKHHKAFLSKKNQVAMTKDEFIDYVRCMTISQNIEDDAYERLTNDNFKSINAYLNDPMSATQFPSGSSPKGGGGDVKTSEVIYYEMIMLGVPFECQKWHLNRLLKLIEVCSRKSGTSKHMSQSDIMRNNTRINAQRRNKYRTKG